MSLGSWTCPGVSTQLQPGVLEGLHEARGLFWFTPRKEGRGDKVAQSAQRGIQSAMNLQRLCLLLLALTRSKPTLDGQGDNPSWMPVFSRRTSQAQPSHQPWLNLALRWEAGPKPQAWPLLHIWVLCKAPSPTVRQGEAEVAHVAIPTGMAVCLIHSKGMFRWEESGRNPQAQAGSRKALSEDIL